MVVREVSSLTRDGGEGKRMREVSSLTRGVLDQGWGRGQQNDHRQYGTIWRFGVRADGYRGVPWDRDNDAPGHQPGTKSQV